MKSLADTITIMPSRAKIRMEKYSPPFSLNLGVEVSDIMVTKIAAIIKSCLKYSVKESALYMPMKNSPLAVSLPVKL